MLNMDYSKRVVVDTNKRDWISSPRPGVWRKPLSREDAERGHATSIVRYEAGASFPSHSHPSGEEILVLEGVFSDENGDYPAGTYIRNPDGSHHAPFSKDGCVILVKLHQFHNEDVKQLQIDSHSNPWQSATTGLKVMPLHSHKSESVALAKLPAGEKFQPHAHDGGEEIYVISGEFVDEHGRYPAGTWIRSPRLSTHYPNVEVDTLVWVKVGHLP